MGEVKEYDTRGSNYHCTRGSGCKLAVTVLFSKK
jgi:hypothetical protein